MLSLPFFWLSWHRLGREFTLKSLLAVALVSLCTALAPKAVRFELLDPWAAAVLGGFLVGFGLLALLRHRASVGGVNILAQWLQQSRSRSGPGHVRLRDARRSGTWRARCPPSECSPRQNLGGA